MKHSFSQETLHNVRAVQAVDAVDSENALLLTQHVAVLVRAKVAERVHVVGQTIHQDRQAVPFVLTALFMKIKELVSNQNVQFFYYFFSLFKTLNILNI